MAGPNDGRKPGAREDGVGRSFREAQPYIDASWQLFASVGLLTAAGYWADKKLGTRPWLLVTGAFLGFAVGLWSFLKVILALDRRRKSEGEDRK